MVRVFIEKSSKKL